jgi:hypothetical protein
MLHHLHFSHFRRGAIEAALKALFRSNWNASQPSGILSESIGV